MQELIKQKLSELKQTKNVRVLYACESGSRAWEFESPDSNFDVRFIYARPREFYLRLNEGRDVIEWQLDELLDINGWDLKKTLQLAYKSNPVLYEWFRSPIVYKDSKAAHMIREAIAPYYKLKSSVYHYLHMAGGNYRRELEGRAEVKYKKYF